MFGLSGRSVTLALVGWLWADILLGLFVIFLAAASPPVPAVAKTGPSVDPKALTLTVPVNGASLLSGDDAQVKTEQSRIATNVAAQLKTDAETRDVAMVFAYGSNQDPVLGQKMAQLTLDAIAQGGLQSQFSKAVLKPLHDIVPGDPGSSVALEIYLYR
ncbi:MAG: hypothetical protein KGN00_05695 [Chloroflexota bacterium]|nr:hypothetical protein [Chloroflexota bacterium]MDE3193163.1 hypothetical protein [Chloroflexota bacterium]